MRQAGVIAAAALYALEHHVDRLADDHRNAQILARAVEETDGLRLESGPVETNLVWIEVDPALGTAADVAARLRSRGRARLGPRAAGAPGLYPPGRLPRASGVRRRQASFPASGRSGGVTRRFRGVQDDRRSKPFPP